MFDKRQIKFIGGGGTDMGVGIEAAASHTPRADVIIVITDGDTPWPDEAPAGIRVIVVLVGHAHSASVPDWAYRIVQVPV